MNTENRLCTAGDGFADAPAGSERLLSKVLVHECEPAARAGIKEFCNRNGLIGVTGPDHSVLEALKANIDLGGVFLQGGSDGLALGRRIRALRPELPIFLRADAAHTALAHWQRQGCVAIYHDPAGDGLTEAVERYIFNRHFPTELVRGIREISVDILGSQFHDAQVGCEPPYLVNDRRIYGQLISLIPLETGWCRGYMMLQADRSAIERAVQLRGTRLQPDAEPRPASSLLGEIANLIWGGIRGRFGGELPAEPLRTQVPILFDHRDGSIAFGGGEPQLCFHYRLRHAGSDYGPIELYQKFVFNLSWTPEGFAAARSVDDYVAAGELELF